MDVPATSAGDEVGDGSDVIDGEALMLSSGAGVLVWRSCVGLDSNPISSEQAASPTTSKMLLTGSMVARTVFPAIMSALVLSMRLT
jgi:hypothetical protein